MKRTSSLVAALTGAALLIASCSSTSGTATPGSSTSSSAAAAPSSVSSAASSASSSVASSEESTSAPAPSESSGPVSSQSADSSVSESVPDTTVGNESGGLDAQSAAWFTAFCGGLAPVLTASGSLQTLGSSAGSDPTAAIKKLVALFAALGTSMTKTAATLKTLPPPTFEGGDAFATKVVTAFGSAGPAITDEAKKIAADPSTLTSSMGGLTDSMTKAVAPLEELGSLKLTPATQNAIENLPACAKVKSLSGG